MLCFWDMPLTRGNRVAYMFVIGFYDIEVLLHMTFVQVLFLLELMILCQLNDN